MAENEFLKLYLRKPNHQARILIALLALLSVCCRSSTATAPVEVTASQPYLLFQKTPCYGPCPAYEAIIYTDGSLTFIGWREVPAVNDTLTLQLSSEELQLLQKKVDKLKIDSLEKSYLSKWSDTPTFYLTFYDNGKVRKRIKHQEGGPPELLLFEKEMESMLVKIVTAHTPPKKQE